MAVVWLANKNCLLEQGTHVFGTFIVFYSDTLGAHAVKVTVAHIARRVMVSIHPLLRMVLPAMILSNLTVTATMKMMTAPKATCQP